MPGDCPAHAPPIPFRNHLFHAGGRARAMIPILRIPSVFPFRSMPMNSAWPTGLLLAPAMCLSCAAPATAQYDVRGPRLANEAEVARQVPALYPAAQRDSGVDGQVLLKFRVLEDSSVDSASVRVLESAHPAFVEPALTIARRMRFAPARVNDSTVAAWIRVPVTFKAGVPPTPPAAPPPDEGTYDISAIEVPPRVRNARQVARQLEVRYPPALRDSLISGDVVLRFRILEDGTVDPASILAILSTHEGFEEPAVSVIGQMRFTPALVNDRPVRVWVEVPIRFAVEAPPAPPTTPETP